MRPNKRLIFTLLWQNGKFCLSRNFRLQLVGDLAWLRKHYNFEVISRAIDELIVLNVSRGDKMLERFASDLVELAGSCFMPIAAGGGIRTYEHARLMLNSGADKLVVNSPLEETPEFITELSRKLGRQCVIVSIDYRRSDGEVSTYIRDGAVRSELSLAKAVIKAQHFGAGEIYANSMERDGTGQGYDLEALALVESLSSVPVIAAGGVGDYRHLAEWLSRERSSAAATANIFNFLGNGLPEARNFLVEQGIPLASWDAEWRPVVK